MHPPAQRSRRRARVNTRHPSGGVTVAVTAVFRATAGSVMTLPRESLASIARPNVAVTSTPARVMDDDELSGRIEETAPSAAPGTILTRVRDPTLAPPGDWNTSTEYSPATAVALVGKTTTNRPSSSVVAPAGVAKADANVSSSPTF